MIVLENTLISEDIIDKNFICNIEKCKGACCIEGSSGAPLELDEVSIIETHIDKIKPYMNSEGLGLLSENNFYETDSDGDLVTTCLPSGECVFVTYNSLGQLQCAIQNAYHKKQLDFEKPISCHLYPIRVSQVGDYKALNYNKWDICSPACELGNQHQMPIYKFLETPLKRMFGAQWYQELSALADEYKNQK